MGTTEAEPETRIVCKSFTKAVLPGRPVREGREEGKNASQL